MPSGEVHARFSEPIASVATVAGVALTLGVHPACTGLVVGAWLGHFLTPDIDHHAITIEERRMYRIHPIVGVLWQLYWWPYQRLRPHRGKSHMIPLGTVERFAYLLWLPVAVSLFLVPEQAIVMFWVLVFGGQLVQDSVHVALDKFSTQSTRR